MIKHGHYAEEILLSTIVSLQKDARGNSCCIDNYRGIALTSAINKVVDWVILLKYKDNLRSSELQFAYKEGHSTTMCTLALKEVVNYYTSRKGRVYCALLDASKAFGRVRFDKLFEALIKRNIPSSIIRLLLNMYQRQKVRTFWDGCLSHTFLTVNGVRQGGVLSPVLFTLYMDMLFTRLEDSGVGCYLGHEFMGALGYADDGTILAPTVSSFRAMLRICEEFGEEYGVTYNGKKTVCLCFSGRRHIDPPSVTLNDVQLVWKSSPKHLGNIITTDLCDDEEIRFKKRDFVARANSVVCNFKLASREVCSQIFVAKYCHLYGCQAWGIKTKTLFELDVCWRKAVRKLWHLPYTARSRLLPGLVGTASLRDQVMRRFAKFYDGISQGKNNKMKLISNISTYCDHRRKGTIGENVECISRLWNCSYDYLCENTASTVDIETSDRVRAIKKLTACKDNGDHLPIFDSSELSDLIGEIACY